MVIDIYGTDHTEFMDHIQGHYHYFRYEDKNYSVVLELSLRKSEDKLRALQVHFPQIESIEDSNFCRELAKLKSEKLWLTPVFINQIKLG